MKKQNLFLLSTVQWNLQTVPENVVGVYITKKLKVNEIDVYFFTEWIFLIDYTHTTDR